MRCDHSGPGWDGGPAACDRFDSGSQCCPLFVISFPFFKGAGVANGILVKSGPEEAGAVLTPVMAALTSEASAFRQVSQTFEGRTRCAG